MTTARAMRNGTGRSTPIGVRSPMQSPSDALCAALDRLLPPGADVEAITAVVEAVATSAAQAAVAEAPPSGRPLTVAEVAREFGRSAEWVREHRTQLGLLPIGAGKGKKPRLLFDPEKVRAAKAASSTSLVSQEPGNAATKPKTRRRRPARSGTSRPLLPIGGQS